MRRRLIHLYPCACSPVLHSLIARVQAFIDSNLVRVLSKAYLIQFQTIFPQEIPVDDIKRIAIYFTVEEFAKISQYCRTVDFAHDENHRPTDWSSLVEMVVLVGSSGNGDLKKLFFELKTAIDEQMGDSFTRAERLYFIRQSSNTRVSTSTTEQLTYSPTSQDSRSGTYYPRDREGTPGLDMRIGY